METFKHVKYEQDRDNNVFVISASGSLDSDINNRPWAEQLVKAYADFDDFVGSSYYKHQRLFKFYTILMGAL